MGQSYHGSHFTITQIKGRISILAAILKMCDVRKVRPRPASTGRWARYRVTSEGYEMRSPFFIHIDGKPTICNGYSASAKVPIANISFSFLFSFSLSVLSYFHSSDSSPRALRERILHFRTLPIQIF